MSQGTKSNAARVAGQKIIAKADYHGGNGYAVSWTIGSERYHVWVNEFGSVLVKQGGKPTLYKNSAAGFRESGYHATRCLDASNGTNKRMVSAAISQVNLAQAKADYDAKEALEDAERVAATVRRKQGEQVSKAAPDVLRVLAMLETWTLNGNDRIYFSSLMPDSEIETLDSVIRSIVRQMAD